MVPRISVILPVYNAGPYLRAAIDSILQQTLTDFELIIINDGSTDDSQVVIDSYQDQRLRVYKQVNQGLRQTLNTAIDYSRGTYIARMDQDDLCFPTRLEAQSDFLDNHPDHVLVGTTYAYIDTTDRVFGIFPALTEDEDIRNELLTKSSFGHGSVMFRAKALQDQHIRYSLEAVHMEDYDMWLRLRSVGKMANLPELLYSWRHSPTNTTSQHSEYQRQRVVELQDRLIETDTGLGIKWPSFFHMQYYRNEKHAGLDHPITIRRRDAFASLYLNLLFLFCRHRLWLKAIRAGMTSVVIEPWYVPVQLWRRFFRSSHL